MPTLGNDHGIYYNTTVHTPSFGHRLYWLVACLVGEFGCPLQDLSFVNCILVNASYVTVSSRPLYAGERAAHLGVPPPTIPYDKVRRGASPRSPLSTSGITPSSVVEYTVACCIADFSHAHTPHARTLARPHIAAQPAHCACMPCRFRTP